MSNKSNWEESRAPAAPAAAGAAEVHDGFQESGNEPAESEMEVVDVAVRKKGGGLAPKLLLGLMGLGVVGIVGFFGTRLMNVGSHKVATAHVVRAPLPVTAAVTEPSHATGQGTVIMGGEAGAASPTAVAVNATSLAPVAAPVAPTAPVAIAGSLSPAPVAPAILVAAAAPQVAPVVAPTDERLNEANARVRGLEQEVQELRGQLAAKASRATRLAGTDQPAVAKHHARPRVRVAAEGAERHEKESAMITEVAAPLTSPEISRLQLRGVYPRSGDDMQAWIMDGDKTRTVSKGDTINGARVLRVETDRVVTSLGSIH